MFQRGRYLSVAGIAVVAALAVGGAVASSAQAAPVTLGFDDQSDGTTVTNQYEAADFVQFGRFTGGAAGSPFTTFAPSPSALASSTPNVLLMAQCSGIEVQSCQADGYIHFEVPQSSISFKLGDASQFAPSNSDVTVTAYDASGNVLTSVTPSIGSGVHTAVTITPSGGPGISFLHFAEAEFNNNIEPAAIDDLTFDNGGSKPSPQIGISNGGEAYLFTDHSPESTVENITIGRFAGSTGPVNLDISGLPPGLDASFAQDPFTGGDGASDPITISAPADTPGLPLKNVTVTATPSSSAGSVPVSTTFALHVLNSYSATMLGISLAQAAGDRPDTAPSGASVSYDGVPLVSGRATLARVFVDPVGLVLAGTAGMSVQLFGSANGQDLPGSPLTADNAGPRSLADETFTTQLGEASTSFNFVLPPSWTTAGPITLTAKATAPGNLLNISPDPTPNATVSCSTCAQSPLTLTLTGVEFTDVPPLVVTPVQMVWTDASTNKLRVPGDPQATLARAYQLAPVNKVVPLGYVDTIDMTPLQSDGIGSDKAQADAQNLLNQWAQNHFQNNGGHNDLGNMVMGFNDTLARGAANLVLLGSDSHGHPVYEPVTTVAANRQLSSVAHEMGHAFGRSHADHTCGGQISGSDPAWPDTTGYIEPTIDEANGLSSPNQKTAFVASYGVDLQDRLLPQLGSPGTPFVIYPSSTTKDLMSYCAGSADNNNPPVPGTPLLEWMSARGWQQEFNCTKPNPASTCPPDQFNGFNGTAQDRGAAADSSTPLAAAAGPAVHGPSISFLGYVEPGGNLMAPATMPSSGGVAGTRSSPFSAQLTDASGRVVSNEPLIGTPTHFDPGPGHGGLALMLLQGFLPTHGKQVARLTVRGSGRVIERISVPRHTPRVKLRKPKLRAGARYLTLRWRTADPDHVRRTAFIALGLARNRFTTIWTGYDRGIAQIPTTSLRSRRIRLRVTISDGFHLGLAYLSLTLPRHLGTPERAEDQGGWRQELTSVGIKVLG
jgi:hypothetical protein